MVYEKSTTLKSVPIPKLNFLLLVVFSFLFVLMSGIYVEAATFYLQPSSGTIAVGDTFFIEVYVDSENETINAVEANLVFLPDLFEVVDADTAGSFFLLSPRPPSFSNSEGTVHFEAGTQNPFNGKAGLVGRMLLRVKEESEHAVISFENMRALLHDGKGTPTTTSGLEAFFDIGEASESIPGLASPSHPDPLRWVSNTTLTIHWDPQPGTSYSYLLSKDVFASADETPDTPVGDIKYEELDDGVYYFHVREVGAGVQGRRAKLRAMIDATPPDVFEVTFVKGEDESGGKPFLSFATGDLTSGLYGYMLCYPTQTPSDEKELCRPVTVPPLLTKDDLTATTLRIDAYDKAGNIRQASVTLPQSFGWKPVIFLLGVLMVGAAIFRIFAIGRLRRFITTLFHGSPPR